MEKKPEINSQIIIKAYREYISLIKIAIKNKYHKGWVYHRLRNKYGELTTYLVKQLSLNPKMTVSEANKIIKQKKLTSEKLVKIMLSALYRTRGRKATRLIVLQTKTSKKTIMLKGFKMIHEIT